MCNIPVGIGTVGWAIFLLVMFDGIHAWMILSPLSPKHLVFQRAAECGWRKSGSRSRLSMEQPSAKSADFDDENPASNRRRMLLHRIQSLGAVVVGTSVGVVSATVHPIACRAAESDNVDPFATMDAAISTGLGSPSSSNLLDAASKSTPSKNNPSTGNSDGSKTTSSSSSDLEQALRQSQRQRTIDPRTHG